MLGCGAEWLLATRFLLQSFCLHYRSSLAVCAVDGAECRGGDEAIHPSTGRQFRMLTFERAVQRRLVPESVIRSRFLFINRYDHRVAVGGHVPVAEYVATFGLLAFTFPQFETASA